MLAPTKAESSRTASPPRDSPDKTIGIVGNSLFGSFDDNLGIISKLVHLYVKICPIRIVLASTYGDEILRRAEVEQRTDTDYLKARVLV